MIQWFKSLDRKIIAEVLFYSGGLFLASIILDIFNCTTLWKDWLVPIVSGVVSIICIIQLVVADK